MPKPVPDYARKIADLEGERVISLREASRMLGVSTDTLRKHFKERIVRVDPKESG